MFQATDLPVDNSYPYFQQTWLGTGLSQWYKFVIPNGYTMAYIQAVGGGAGGGAGGAGVVAVAGGGGGGGGGSGAIVNLFIPVTFLTSAIYIQPGVGGAGGLGTVNTGGTGGTGGISYVCTMPRITKASEILLQSNSGLGGATGGVGGQLNTTGGAAGAAGVIGVITNQFMVQCGTWQAYTGQDGVAGSSGGAVSAVTPASFITAGGGGGCGVAGGAIAASGIVPSVDGGVSSANSSGPGQSGLNCVINRVASLPMLSQGGAGGGMPSSTATERLGTGGNGGPGSGGGGGGGGADFTSGTVNGCDAGNGGPGFVTIILY